MAADVLDFRPPELRLVEAAAAPLRRYFAPVFYGLEHVNPTRPALFVANHTVYAILDPALYISELYRRHHIWLRSLGDYLHQQLPGYRRFARRLGVVRGDPGNCARLMQAGAFLLCYPGGARESAKRKGEEHRLVWQDHAGFARLAIEHRYDIIPLASVGPDYALDIVFDADDLLASPLGKLLRRSGLLERALRDGDLLYPLVRGLGPTPLPRPERFHIAFGAPLATRRYRGDAGDANTAELRAGVEDALEELLQETLVAREEAPADRGLRRLLNRL